MFAKRKLKKNIQRGVIHKIAMPRTVIHKTENSSRPRRRLQIEQEQCMF